MFYDDTREGFLDFIRDMWDGMGISCYAGIGSRSAPGCILNECLWIASTLARTGITLRSGGAAGCDTAFEEGCDLVRGQKQIFLPWKQFNNNKSPLYVHHPEAFVLANKYHPRFAHLKTPVKALMMRNMQQILGYDLDSPSKFVVCWTRDGKDSGGTGTAIRCAKDHSIPVFNLFNWGIKD